MTQRETQQRLVEQGRGADAYHKLPHDTDGRPVTTTPSQELATLSIGVVAQQSGIPVNTLRTWERRYGFPEPERTAGGHRLYRPSTAVALRRIQNAIDSGARAGNAIRTERSRLAPAPQTNANDNEHVRGYRAALRRPDHALPPDDLHAEILTHVRSMDDEKVDRAFQVAWARLGGERFLDEWVSPLLCEVGWQWAEGTIDVVHEHFISARLEMFLEHQLRSLNSTAKDTPTAYLMTLERDAHSLGMHLAAVAAALAGTRVIYVGKNTPAPQVAHFDVGPQGSTVIISVSSTLRQADAHEQLSVVLAEASDGMRIIIGGLGSPASLKSATIVRSFAALRRELEAS